MSLTPHDFVTRWENSALREQQAAQSHFTELCQLVHHPTPTQADPKGEFFTFEEQVAKASGGKGRADVWLKGHFAWEYKGKHKDLDDAYTQLLAYKGDLENPPLLVVCDFLEYRIYPQWPNLSGRPFIFQNRDLLEPKALNYIDWLLRSPQKFYEERQRELKEREKLTLDLASRFAELADVMRRFGDAHAWQPMQIARFLTKITFALFVEDIGLLPSMRVQEAEQSIFRFMLESALRDNRKFTQFMQELFRAMDGDALANPFMPPIPYFNGGLFAESAPGAGDGAEVLDITAIPNAIDLLRRASEADWRDVNPTVFGTLFEGALDRAKRAQLGVHYTSEADVRLVIEPVLMAPLNRLWDETRAEAEPLLQSYLSATTPRAKETARASLLALYGRMIERLANTRVLDPACGSGNFLYVSLRALKDLEGKVRQFFEPLGLPFRDVVTPRQLYGIEKDPFAARLAQIVVWIGYLQWRYEHEGDLYVEAGAGGGPAHPRELSVPILRDKDRPDEPERILNDDAILRYDAAGQPYEPDWPEAEVIVGNPPFLGTYRLRSELGDKYLDDMWAVYDEHIPDSTDLVCYWFEKARAHIEKGKAKRAGLLATNSIRGGVNRHVLDRIKQTGNIFMAWSDREWAQEGVAVRVSMIGFDDDRDRTRTLDGRAVFAINSDLTEGIDLTFAKQLPENADLCLRCDEKHGPFDIPEDLAFKMLSATNVSGKPNSDIVRPYFNASDVVGRARGIWIIDFAQMELVKAEEYELPMEYVRTHVKPIRDKNNRPSRRERWWQHGEVIPGMRQAVAPLRRFIATPRHSKYRLFVWFDAKILPDSALAAVAREDDYFFGVLHSYAHEAWSLRLGTWLGKGNDPRYTPTTTFETFPFPWAPGTEYTDGASYRAISAAAAALHAERDAWLNPADGRGLKERTLTALYNAVEEYREVQRKGEAWMAGEKAARQFAPRLAALHEQLDRAVLGAYGWADLAGRLRTPDGDEEMLRRLLALNLQRAT